MKSDMWVIKAVKRVHQCLLSVITYATFELKSWALEQGSGCVGECVWEGVRRGKIEECRGRGCFLKVLYI